MKSGTIPGKRAAHRSPTHARSLGAKVLGVAEAPAEYGVGLPRVRKTIQAGRRGAAHLTAIYGEQLLCVRHRFDPVGGVRLTTVELVVARTKWSPFPTLNPSLTVGLRVSYNEKELRERIKAAGVRWDPKARLWKTSLRKAIELGLADRVIVPDGSEEVR